MTDAGVAPPPTRLVRYATVTGACGFVLAAALAVAGNGAGHIDPTLIVFSLAALGAVMLPIRFQRDGGTQAFNVEGGIALAMLLAGYSSLAALVLVLASVIGHGLRSRSVLKTVFNSGRSGLETGMAAVVYQLLALETSTTVTARTVTAAVVAALVFELVSIALMTELFHRLSAGDRRELARDVSRLSLVTLGGNVSYGIVLASLATVHVLVALLAATFMLVMYVGYRGYAAALEGQRRAAAVNDITHVLLDMGGREAGFKAFLEEVSRVFGARSVHLVLRSRSACHQWHLDGDELARTPLEELPRVGLMGQAIAQSRGCADVLTVEGPGPADDVSLAAPILRHGQAVGAIAVAGRRGVEPWGDADVSLLSTIANELAVVLDNVSLFRQVEEERARLESESTKLNDILTAATDGIVSVRAGGSIEAWNPGMARITGVDADAAIGQPWHAVLRLKDETGSELAPTGDHVMSQAMAGQHAGESLTLQALRADGVWRWLQCTSSPVRNPDGSTRGVVLVARDVTGERELEELKSDFIATVSHELRTPLTPLKGFLSTLRNPRTALSEDQLGAIHGAMGTQLLRLETLISDLLAVAEIDLGQFDLRPEPQEISDLVADAVEVEAADELSRCSVLVEPEVTAVADSVALVRIVRSLVSNALKHTPGEVEVIVRTLADHVEVVVRDEGPGIAQWDQERIFNRFERLGNHLNRTQGPGLGLTIARSLARRMGGDVQLTSDIGRGATFTLTLPRARPRSVPLRVASEA